MRIDVDAKLLDRKGRPIKDGDVEVTFGDAVAHAFENPQQSEFNGMRREEKLRRAKVAQALGAGGVQEFKDAEIEEIRNVTAWYPIPIVSAIDAVIKAAGDSA